MAKLLELRLPHVRSQVSRWMDTLAVIDQSLELNEESSTEIELINLLPIMIYTTNITQKKPIS